MAAPVTVEQVMELAKQLTKEEQERVLAKLLELKQAAQSSKPTSKTQWKDLQGLIPGPWYGEDAQTAISRERALGDYRQRFPFLAARELVAEGQQRLVGALGLAVEAAHLGQEVFDAVRGSPLAHARGALVAHLRQLPLVRRFLCDRVQERERLG